MVMLEGPEHFIYVVSSGSSSAVWVGSPVAEPQEKILTVSHMDGYPIHASVDARGRYLAFANLLSGNRPAFTGALELYRIGINPSQTVIDTNIDYGWPPEWSPTGDQFSYVKKVPLTSSSYVDEIWVSDVVGHKMMIYRDADALEIVPVGWSPNGQTFFFERILPDAADLYSLTITPPQSHLIAHLGSSPAYNLSLSPDGSVVFGSIRNSKDHSTFDLISISVNADSIARLRTGGSTPYSIAWNTMGGVFALNNKPSTLEYLPAHVRSVSDPAGGQLQALSVSKSSGAAQNAVMPLAFSPDGKWLALQVAPGNIQFLDVDRTALIAPISSTAWVDFVGWIN
jgi:WD40 repeat protein